MRIAICDDDKRELEQTVEALHGWDRSREAECFTDGKSLLEAAAMAEPFSIVFLDIYMPGENGMDIAASLQKISPDTGIVFVTTSQEHAIEAFSLQALHYLVKPVTTEGIIESFRRLTELQSKKRRILRISRGREDYTLYMDEISYLLCSNHATEIRMKNGDVIRTWTPIKELSGLLDETFLKLNRSTIVNMEQIRQMRPEACFLQDGTRLEFARRERSAIRNAYDDYLFSRLRQMRAF